MRPVASKTRSRRIIAVVRRPRRVRAPAPTGSAATATASSSSSGASPSSGSASGSGSSPCDGALAARKVATSMISRPKNTCARRKRRPTRRQLRNSRFTCFGQRVGGDVEVLRLDADQQVAHAAADQERHEARIAQAVQHAQRIRRDVGAGDGVLGPRDDPRRAQQASRRTRRGKFNSLAFGLSNWGGSL